MKSLPGILHDPVTSHTVSGISSMATRNLLVDLVDCYARDAGQAVAIEATGGVEAARRVLEGEAFDVVVLAADAIARLIEAGRLVADSRVDIARSQVAVAVASGTARPDIANEAALRRAVLSAGSVGYSTGPSGTHLSNLFERWGIADAIASRIVLAAPGVPVGSLIASGEVELGFQQYSELLHVPGIEIVGMLPGDVDVVTVFSAAICTACVQREAARALIGYLASAEAAGVKRAHGMEPV
ncbi:substrate-binding domain-containing protein [Paraburkholderia sp. BCC1886]|uniref:substrate-binding domain-containing protein n=1 Tax=Paraburkholderia sp. BCC1886 TaxID=2562670 RepID=UPI001181C8DD|nr:substrate-binding domain-containing protein [Paraburkholderia sp. BCC1886]